MRDKERERECVVLCLLLGLAMEVFFLFER